MDKFTNIAINNRITDKNELAISKPITFERKLFKHTDAGSCAVNEKTFDQRLLKFKSELKTLRETYKPFLNNLTPESSIHRNKMELIDFKFRFETDVDKEDIANALMGKGEWIDAKLPDYRGPVGKWTGYYRTEFAYGKITDTRVLIKFSGVDYIANVYLNQRYIGSHEGFFAPFEFDITNFIKSDEKNILFVELKNDIPTIGNEDCYLNGDKLYAATGLGWDDPEVGWHHCPAGAGIYNGVVIEERSDPYIHSVFIKPDIDNSNIEATAMVFSSEARNIDISLYISIFPRNFNGSSMENIPVIDEIAAGPGMNYYNFKVHIDDFMLWTVNNPWLYTARVHVGNEIKGIVDTCDTIFGMRKFHMDENSDEKGTLYLNNEPIILRGANDMGHMQQCVIKGEYEQLIDDILIAKIANMNFFRFTQRPVQEEIYHYCDMLGMLNQTDFPLFGYLRKNKITEALRQVEEMEMFIRNHPSSIIISYINEPSNIYNYKYLKYRHVNRTDLECFFKAADMLVKIQNSDRVVKHVEGDYDPPTGVGLSDFHCYNMWYTNHALPIGELYKGYLPATKKGWKIGCGEYGTEGLDNYDVMTEFYPKEWLPENEYDEWYPNTIVAAQTYNHHKDWFEEQTTIKDWIKESQKHQAFATRLMTDAFRRRSDKIISTAIHLLIDAWPSGWMKTIVGVDRIPKPAYFSFKDCLEPVRVNLRCDRWKVYQEEILDVEAWILNDTGFIYNKCRIIATLRDNETDYCSFDVSCNAGSLCPTYAGTIRIKIPTVKDRKTFFIDASMQDKSGVVLNTERFCIDVFDRYEKDTGKIKAYLGDNARNLVKVLGLKPEHSYTSDLAYDFIFISDPDMYAFNKKVILEKVRSGAKAFFLLSDNGEECSWDIDEGNIEYKKMNGIFFVARSKEDEVTKDFSADDFSYWYNANRDIIDFVTESYIDSNKLKPMLFTYKNPNASVNAKCHKEVIPIAGSMKFGEGEFVFLSFCIDGRAGYNPVLDRFISKLTE